MCGTEIKHAGEPVLYRIIGLFKDIELSNGKKINLIKVIREESIGQFAWDLESADGTGYDNNWYDASLNNILNNGYLKNASNITHYYYDPLSGTIVTKSTDFTNIGINQIQNKIESVVWNLGGYSSAKIYADQIYQYERGKLKCTDCTYEPT